MACGHHVWEFWGFGVCLGQVLKEMFRLRCTPHWSYFSVLQLVLEQVKDHSILTGSWSAKATWRGLAKLRGSMARTTRTGKFACRHTSRAWDIEFEIFVWILSTWWLLFGLVLIRLTTMRLTARTEMLCSLFLHFWVWACAEPWDGSRDLVYPWEVLPLFIYPRCLRVMRSDQGVMDPWLLFKSWLSFNSACDCGITELNYANTTPSTVTACLAPFLFTTPNNAQNSFPWVRWLHQAPCLVWMC